MFTKSCWIENRSRYPHLPPTPATCVVQKRQSGSCINSTQRSYRANSTSNPVLRLSCFYSLFLSLTGDGVQLKSRARTLTSGSALSFPSHFINTASDWLKARVNFYSSLLASEGAEVAKIPLSCRPSSPTCPCPACNQPGVKGWRCEGGWECSLLVPGMAQNPRHNQTHREPLANQSS